MDVSLDRWVGSPRARLAVRVLMVLVASGLSVAFFGLCVPFFLLSAEVLPSLGVAGVLYLAVGGLAGLLFGAITTSVSLRRSPRLVTPWCVGLIGTLALLILAYTIAYLNVEWMQRHI